MTLAQMQARFFEIKGKLAVGQIQEEEFKRELERLRFQDAQGRWWMIGAQSGRWYYYDGARWLLGDPPEPPPPAISAGEPVTHVTPAAPLRPATPTTAYPAADAGSSDSQTISVPYTYAPAAPTPARPVQPPPAASVTPTPAPGNGTPQTPVTPSPQAPRQAEAVAAAAATTAVARHTLTDTLRQDLGKVHLPHVQRPNTPAANAPVPPQFVSSTPAARKFQPPYLLIGAALIGILLVALLWLAVDNLVPGKPVSTFFGQLSGRSAVTQRPTSPRPTPIVGGQNVDNLIRVGDELVARSQFEPAIAQFQAAAKYSPNDADIYTHWAHALALTGRLEEAVSTANKATKLDPTSANAYTELARAYAWSGENQPAVSAGEKAIALDPENATAHAILAEAYLRVGRNNDAQQAVDKALELDDANAETHRAAGWAAILSGRKDEGVSEWNRAIELAPETFLYYYELGLVYANHLNDPAAAIPSFQKAIQLYPPYIPSYTALGRAYLAANQPGPAILQFQKALTLDPKSSDAFVGLGQAFQLQQKCPQAIPYFQKALDLDKDQSQAARGLEDCGALAKGSAPPEAQPTNALIAPLATAVPQVTVAPAANNAQPTPQVTPAVAGAASTGAGRIYFPVHDGQYRIFSANPDGSDLRMVTELASSPAVSADGARMLFYSWVSDQRGIHRINTDGGDDLHISLRAEDTLPSWSPDGGKYVYSTRAGQGGDINKRAYTVRVASTGGKPRQDPAPLIAQAQYPTWGPTDQIVFRDCGFPTDVCGLAIVNPDGGGKKPLTNINSTAPAWSPDGSRIVFMSDVAGNWDLYAVSVNGGSPERLTDDLGNDGLPVYSPDGSKIAFVSRRDGVWAIWQIDPDGENETKLFDLPGEIAGAVSGNSPAQPGQVWTEQRIAWR